MGKQSEAFEGSLTNRVAYLGKEASYVCGIRLITSALYDFSSCVYEAWRGNSIDREIKKIKENPYKKNTLKINVKRQQEVLNRIAFLSKVKPREDFIRYVNHLKYGTDILQAVFIGARTLNIMLEGHKEGRNVYSLLPDPRDYKFENGSIKSKISIFGTAASLVSFGRALSSVSKLARGEKA